MYIAFAALSERDISELRLLRVADIIRIENIQYLCKANTPT